VTTNTRAVDSSSAKFVNFFL